MEKCDGCELLNISPNISEYVVEKCQKKCGEAACGFLYGRYEEWYRTEVNHQQDRKFDIPDGMTYEEVHEAGEKARDILYKLRDFRTNELKLGEL